MVKSKFQKYSSTILTIIGATGLIITSVLAANATPKAKKTIEEKKTETGTDKLNIRETVKTCWKCYAPTVATGLATLFCIFGTNVLNKKQQASLTSAYALLDNSYRKYRRKLKELLGKETDEKITESIAAENCKDTHIYCPGCIGTDCTLDFGDGKIPEIERLFYDSFSNRYFQSTVEKVLQAEYHLNRNFMLEGEVSLNDFYDFLGMDKMLEGNQIGWTMQDDFYWIDFNHHKAVLDDGMEVYIIDMIFEPTADWRSDDV